jgi:hypothetical protein
MKSLKHDDSFTNLFEREKRNSKSNENLKLTGSIKFTGDSEELESDEEY